MDNQKQFDQVDSFLNLLNKSLSNKTKQQQIDLLDKLIKVMGDN